MFSLRRHGRDVSFAGCSVLCCGWPCSSPTFAAVIAHISNRGVDDDGLVVDVRHIDHVIDGAVVEERAVPPIPAFIAEAAVTKPIVDAAVESDERPPIPLVKDEEAAVPAPPSRCP